LFGEEGLPAEAERAEDQRPVPADGSVAALAEAGATWAEIAREGGYDWRTVKINASGPAEGIRLGR
jgi:hypothetical protein